MKHKRLFPIIAIVSFILLAYARLCMAEIETITPVIYIPSVAEITSPEPIFINGATNPVDAAPGTIRGDFALDVGRNVVHASDSPDAAAREITIHFKDSEIGKYSRIDEVCLYE